ncbi:MAG: FAD-binding protein [Betaproteobacteria bacterium]|nr:FAD-binding protein [Betaproteobacteria bacterium]
MAARPPTSPAQRNWAGNLAYTAAAFHQPETLAELQDLIAASRRIKILGSRHSFNAIADTDADLVSLNKFAPAFSLDHVRRTVTVPAATRYGTLSRYLHEQGWALPNLASLPHISVAGACATATHGSGDRNGNLATAVSALEMVCGGGELITLTRENDPQRFFGAVVGLGALGAVARLTLDIIPSFEIRQRVYENLPLAQLREHFDEIFSSAYSVSLFTDWRSTTFNQVWLKQRVDGEGGNGAAPQNFFGATPAAGPLHPIAGCPADCCTQQMGLAGPWHERLPHFRMDFTPSSGEELQSEYFVARTHAAEVLAVIARLGEHIAPLLQISEVRSIAADRLWMSPCYEEDCIAIHFTWKQDEPAVTALLPLLEARLAAYQARPHWGKLFTMTSAKLRARYARLEDFRRLAQEYDPAGKFRNAFLEKTIFSAEVAG